MAFFHLENFTAAKEAFSDALKLDSKQHKYFPLLYIACYRPII